MRKKAEEALQESETKYRLLFENMINGFALHEIVLDRHGKPVDYVFLEFNSAFEKLTGLTKNIIGKKVTEALPGIEQDPGDWIGRYGKIALNSHEERFEQHSEPLGKWFDIVVFSPQKGRFATIFSDVSQRKEIEIKLAEKNQSLEKINQDLQNALDEIKTLSGLLPICSYCKKIRDDKGYWNQIEDYIHKHSEAKFSHGICKECAKKHFPDMDLYDE